MKKVLMLALVAVFALTVAACNQEEIKKLNDQVASLTTENQQLKAKVADLEKGKADLAGQVAAANAAVEGAKKDTDACKAEIEELLKNKNCKKPVAKDAKAAAPAKEEKKAEKKAAPAKGEKKAKAKKAK
jgi:cell division protein FtsL